MTIPPISTPMLLGGAAVLAGGYYLLSKKDSNNPQAVAAQNAKVTASAATEVVSEVVMDGATEEYNMARERYRMVAGSYPPRSWTIDMINSWIEEQSKKETILKQYVALVSANSTYVQRQDTSEMTYTQLQGLIDSANATIAAGKARDAKLKEYNNYVTANSKYVSRENTDGKNADQIQALLERAQAEVNRKKQAEQTRRNQLSQLCDKFIANATAYPGAGATTLSKYNWDTAMLMDIKALPAAEKRIMNELLLEKTGGKGILCCSYQAEAKSLWKYHKTIPEICALTVNSGKTACSRNGAWACREVVEAFNADKVGADGSVIFFDQLRRDPMPNVNPLIAFHLRDL